MAPPETGTVLRSTNTNPNVSLACTITALPAFPITVSDLFVFHLIGDPRFETDEPQK